MRSPAIIDGSRRRFVRTNFISTIPEADAAELERVLTPAMVRDRGFFARTLRLGDAPAPDWLKARRADGTVAIGTLTFGDTQVHVDTARLLWDAAQVRLVGLNAHVDQAALAGDLTIDLRRPRAALSISKASSAMCRIRKASSISKAVWTPMARARTFWRARMRRDACMGGRSRSRRTRSFAPPRLVSRSANRPGRALEIVVGGSDAGCRHLYGIGCDAERRAAGARFIEPRAAGAILDSAGCGGNTIEYR